MNREMQASLQFLTTPKPIYRRIILIENEDIQRKVTELSIKCYLKGFEIEILQFANAAEALFFLQNEMPCHQKTALFLDLFMPVLNGWQFLDKISDPDRRFIDIYILSSSVSLVDIDRATANPKVKGYISKPILPAVNALFDNTRRAFSTVTFQ